MTRKLIINGHSVSKTQVDATEYKVSEEDIEIINNRVKDQVEESVKFAEESPWPDNDELLKDVYIQEDYPYITD